MNLDILPQTAYSFLIIFGRLGAMMMVMPVLGETGVSRRIRLMFALALTFVLYPMINAHIPPLPDRISGILWLMLSEILLGIAIGWAVRLMMSIMQFAGTLIAFQTGLAFAQNVDPTQGVQSALFASFLSIFAVTMIFAANLHHLLIGALHGSYTLFAPGKWVNIGDFSALAFDNIAIAFKISVQLAAPFLAFGLIFYLGIGVLSRLMPQVQIFFIAMPINIMIGLILFAMLLGAIITWFLTHFEERLLPFAA